MMFKYASAAVGIVAVLLAGFLPAGDACALTVSVHHECCAEPTPEPTSSCCAVDQTPSSAAVHTGDTCFCTHTPQAPADRALAPAPAAPETSSGVLNTAAFVAIEALTPRTPTGVPQGGPPGESHPIFILDCAFLI